MLFSKLTRYGTRLALSLILGLALVTFLPPPVQAQQPINLMLGGEGATSWNIDKIKPGDSGIKTVELRNAGSRNGSVTIWITGINETDYAGDGAALGDYLFFNLSCGRLNTNITLPARIYELPQNASAPNYIKITPLNAGETISLTWRWEFQETGKPQNDAQGDSLSFTINYLLQELPSGGGGGGSGGTLSYQQLEIDILGTITLARASWSGELLDSYVASDPDNKHQLELSRGTKVSCVSGKVPRRIVMKVTEEPLSAPAGTEIIGLAYSLVGYIDDSVSCPVTFDPAAELTLSYDPGWLPKETSPVFIASCGAEEDWVELELASAGVAESGKITALIRHTSTFAAVARLGSLPPAPAPAARTEFRLSDLVINPAEAEVGNPVIISIMVRNTGEDEGTYTLMLKINGKVEQSKGATLAAGESTQIAFAVVKDSPGTYVVAVDGLIGEFTVLAPASSPPSLPWINVHWWFVLLAALIIAFLVYFLAIRPRHHL